MRILVLSDSHRISQRVREAYELIEDVSMIIHLGDGERDMAVLDDLPAGVKVVQVRGNCDFGSELPAVELLDVGGKRIFCTHGHLFHVKFGDAMIMEEAEKYNADITLYGHTHTPVTKFKSGRYYFNPGSLLDGNFGYIDIVGDGVNCVQLNLKDFR